mgnify:CR=1 FL=1
MKVLKWIGIVLGSLLGLVLVAGVVLYFMGDASVTASHGDEVFEASALGTADVERGKYLVEDLVGCTGCHGDDLSGVEDLMFEFEGQASPMGVLPAPNLTPNGVAGNMDTDGWVRALRHGVGNDGRGLIIMPSSGFATLSADDLASMIAYLETIPPAGEPVGGRSISTLGKIVLAAGMFPDEYKLSQGVEQVEVPRAATAEYGAYLAGITCFDCFWDLSDWSEDDFRRVVREGVLPDGSPVEPSDPDAAPWANLDSVDVDAMWAYVEDEYKS